MKGIRVKGRSFAYHNTDFTPGLGREGLHGDRGLKKEMCESYSRFVLTEYNELFNLLVVIRVNPTHKLFFVRSS